MTGYNFNDYTDWQLKIHILLGQGFGVEDIAIKLNHDVSLVRAEIHYLRRKGDLMLTIKHWAKPAIKYEASK